MNRNIETKMSAGLLSLVASNREPVRGADKSKAPGNAALVAGFLVSTLMCLAGSTAFADGLASDYDSLPPLISTATSGDRPNVLLMLDTSGSMDYDKDDAYVGPNYYTSRTIMSRQAIATLMDNFSESVRMGLMAFEPAPSFNYKVQGTSPNQFWEGQNLNCCTNYAINKGYLYIPIGSVDPNDTSSETVARRAEFTSRLGLNIVSQATPSSGYYNLFTFDNDSYTSSSDYTNKRLVSNGGTPIAGTYQSALAYKNGSLASSLRLSSISSTDAVWPSDNVCENNDYAILITDGLPSVNIAGKAGNDYVDEFMPEVLTQAEALLAAGVQTYVIGFSIPSGSDKLDKMAAAGGTDQAYFANNLTELTSVLDAIFTDIINKTSSGTGAAVVANRGNGLSADFQALYTPEKVYDGKTVKWVGTLQGFFIDENRLLREDTNGDGLLGDYTVDRILEFNYDENDKVTYVERKLSASATDPTQTSSGSTITSEIEEVAGIWNARDQLAAINDVLTQRSYSASAGTGRRIYTSVDGENMLNFVQLGTTDLAALEQQEQDLRDRISAIEDDVYGTAATPTVSDLNDLATLLDALSTEVLQTGDVDGVDDGDLLDDVYSLLQQIASDRATIEGSVAAEEANLTAAQTLESAELADLTQAQTDLATQTAERDAAQAALDQANADKTAADQALADAETALTDAETARDDAQQALTDAQAAEATAQSERDTAAADVASAQTDVNNAQSVVDTETLDRNTAATNLAQAVSDYNTAQSNLSDAQTAYNGAVTTAASEKADSDAALAVRDQAQSDLDAAQQAYDDAVATYPPMHPNIAAAQDDLDKAQAIYDAADAEYQTQYNEWQSAEATVTTRQGELNTAQNNANTATTDRANAQAAYDQAEADLAAANSDLAAAQGTLTAAQGTLTDKESALAAASADVTAKQSDLTAKETAVTDATTARDDAVTAQSDAQAAVVAATTTRDTEQTDVDNANQAVADAQAVYDAAVSAREAVDDELSRLNNILSELDATEAWANDVLAAASNLRDLITALNALGSASAAQRADLLAQITARYNELQALLSSAPSLAGDPEVTTLLAAIQTVLDEIANVSVIVNDGVPGTVAGDAESTDSIADLVADIDNSLTEKEGYEAQLYNTDIAIDAVDFVRYMDDNIPGQTGDVDLTYDQRSDIVGWIRGEEISGLRNRTIDFDKDNVDEVWRLADIVHSTPTVVGRPADLYYSRYGDTTYRSYMAAKFNRRQVVYVGSNDGVLHAFNSGFWDDSQKGYVTQLSGSTAVAHPLGSELWGFVPKAALPHLQFVANTGYSHMALMDGAPQALDVNIFPHDTDHPDGWGTILVVTMRMGGGAFTVRVDEDEDGVDEDVVIRPSVLIFDVTNPEVEPTLIAELSHPEMGFTLGRPTLIKNRVASDTGSWSDPAVNRWLLVFGSGPTDLDTATSTQQARLYAYDLNEKEWASDWSGSPMTLSLESNAFVGDLSAEDWDRDYVDDAVYFGLNTGTSAAPDGRLARLRLRSDQAESSWLSAASIGTLTDIQRTIIGAPLAKSDVYGRRWVYFGTGRLLVAADNNSSQQEYFAGVKEPIDSSYELTFATVSTGSLLDVSNINVYTNPDKIENGPSGVTNPAQLVTYMNENNDGWIRDLESSSPGGRSDTRPVSYLDSISFSEFIPSDDPCNPEGESNIWTINYVTGVAFKEIYLDSVPVGTSGLTQILPSLNVGPGKTGDLVTLPGGALASHNSMGEVDIIEQYIGDISLRRQSWRQIFNIEF